MTLISFTICNVDDGTVLMNCEAEENMTWEKFVNSSYSQNKFSIDTDGYIMCDLDGSGPSPCAKVLKNSIIVEGYEYQVGGDKYVRTQEF